MRTCDVTSKQAPSTVYCCFLSWRQICFTRDIRKNNIMTGVKFVTVFFQFYCGKNQACFYSALFLVLILKDLCQFSKRINPEASS